MRDASRVPGFLTTMQPEHVSADASLSAVSSPPAPEAAPIVQALPRPLPPPVADVPEERAVAHRTAVNAMAWSSLPKSTGEDNGWDAAQVNVTSPEGPAIAGPPDVSLTNVARSDDAPTGNALSHNAPAHNAPADDASTGAAPTNALSTNASPAHALPAHASPTHASPTYASSTNAAATYAAPTHDAHGDVEEDLAAHITAALPPELASEVASSFDDESGAADPRKSEATTPTATDTIPNEPALRTSTSAPPTVISPVQAGAQMQTEIIEPPQGEDPLRLPSLLSLLPEPSRESADDAVVAGEPPAQRQSAHDVAQLMTRPPRPPPVTDAGPNPAARLASGLMPASDDVARGPRAHDQSRNLDEQIHTRHTALDLEPLPRIGLSPTMLALGLGAIAIGGLVLGIVAISQWRGDTSVDAGAVLIDAGSAPLAAPPDAGAAPVATLVDAGTIPSLDTGSAPITVVDAGPPAPIAAETNDAGPASTLDDDEQFAAHMKQAYTASKRGAFPKSIRAYKAALARKPTSVAALLGLGNAYYELDMNDAALKRLEKARALAPRDPQLYVLLGAVYQTLGRKSDATSAYNRYLALAPEGKFARDVKGILKGLATQP